MNNICYTCGALTGLGCAICSRPICNACSKVCSRRGGVDTTVITNYPICLHDLNVKMFLGIDEVGRGAVAGPLVVAAVIPGNEFDVRLIQKHGKLLDSKRMNKVRIPTAADHIRKTCYYGLGAVSSRTIDRIGIDAATRLAIFAALMNFGHARSKSNPTKIDQMHAGDRTFVLGRINAISYNVEIIVDGRDIPDFILHRAVPNADITYPCVTAASLIAKDWRDGYMRRLSGRYPVYGFDKNVGYRTAFHTKALTQHGLCRHHRRTFLSDPPGGTFRGVCNEER